MPEPGAPRIGVITSSSAAYTNWRDRVSASGVAFSWSIDRIEAIRYIREMNANLTAVLCLPGWERIEHAQEILEGARALIVSPNQRGSRRDPIRTPPALPAGATRALCIEYMQCVHPGLIPVDRLMSADLDALRQLRSLSMRCEAAALSYRSADRMAIRVEFLQLVERVRYSDPEERLNISSPRVDESTRRALDRARVEIEETYQRRQLDQRRRAL